MASPKKTNAGNKVVMPTISGLLNKRDEQPSGSSSPESSAKSSSKSVKDLLRRNTSSVSQARTRLSIGRSKKFYFLTIPGILRIIQIFFSMLHVATIGFYCTYYEDRVPFIIPPFFLSHTREQFFLLANYHTMMGCLTIVFSGIFNSKSNTALLSSLYPLIFDFIQFLACIASSLSLIQFYRQNAFLIHKVMPMGSSVKEGFAFSGLFLACLHVVTGIYGGIVFMKHINTVREQEAARRIEEEL